MNEIIKIEKQTIGNENVNSVNGRDLHAFLEVGKDFSTWIKDRIDKYEFIENVDFVKISCSPIPGSKHGGHNRIECHLSIDMAKELSMVENNERGRQARKYFIACENRLKTSHNPLPNFTDPAEAAIAWAEQYKRAQIEEQKRIEAERTKAHISDKKTATAMATASHLTRENNKLREQVGDSKHYKQVKAIPWLEESFNVKIKAAYSVIGKHLTKISNELQREVKEIDHSKYGTVKAYSVDVIDEFRRRVKADAGFLGKYRA